VHELAAEEDHGGRLTEAFDDGEAGLAAKVKVEQDCIVGGARELRERLGGAPGLGHVVTLVAQQAREHGADQSVVVADEDAHRAHIVTGTDDGYAERPGGSRTFFS